MSKQILLIFMAGCFLNSFIVFAENESAAELLSKGSQSLLQNNFQEALKYLTKCKAMMEEQNEQENITYGICLLNLSAVHLNLVKIETGLKLAEQGKKVFEKLDMLKSHEYAAALLVLGSAFRVRGDLGKAETYLSQSIDIYKSLKLTDTRDFGGLLLNYASLLYQKSKFSEANKYYLEAKELYIKLKLEKTRDYAAMLFGLGISYYVIGQKETAKETLLESKNLYEELKLEKMPEYSYLASFLKTYYPE